MDRQVVGVVFFGVVAMVAVLTLPQLLDVVWCSAVVAAVVAVVVAVVQCSGAVVVMQRNQCSCKRSCSCSRGVVTLVWCGAV